VKTNITALKQNIKKLYTAIPIRQQKNQAAKGFFKHLPLTESWVMAH
jgi:hypothetical protein